MGQYWVDAVTLLDQIRPDGSVRQNPLNVYRPSHSVHVPSTK